MTDVENWKQIFLPDLYADVHPATRSQGQVTAEEGDEGKLHQEGYNKTASGVLSEDGVV